MRTLKQAVKTAWLVYWARHFANEASRYEMLAFEHFGSTAGDIAQALHMRYRDKAMRLTEELR